MIRVLFISLLFLSACQVKPTKVATEETIERTHLKGAEILKLNPVLLDVRPAFDFNLAHAPGAINVRWEDFSQQNPQSRGVPLVDQVSVARRLALIGVGPKTPVVVLGGGEAGMGEEGRVAWTLRLLGVEDVYTLNANLVKDRSQVRETPPVKNQPYWNPGTGSYEKLLILLPEFKAAVKDSTAVVLDVRSLAEVQVQSLKNHKNLKATFLHLEWKNFFDKNGAPAKAVQEKLKVLGLTPEKKVFVISNHGVRSGAVTFALESLGWKNVKNFAGGYEQFGYK